MDRIVEQLESPPWPDARWATVYVGGGTPSLLSADQWRQLLQAVAPRLAAGGEVTFEANPESLEAGHLEALASGSGTRLSLGIQSFQEAILVRHGRPTRRVHLDRAKALVAGWPGQLSLDLICGLEGQTEAGQRRDLEEAVGWQPEHLSFYSLTVEPGTPLHRRSSGGRRGLPPDDEAARWWLDGRDYLESVGLRAYEVSNFAVPGAESRHNQRYWELRPWWGVGPSAVSFLRGADTGEYRTEPAALGRWLVGQAPEVEPVTRLELAKDTLLAGLRTTQGLEVAAWPRRLPRTLGRWQGRAVVQGNRLFLTREAFPFLDAFLREAFAELDESPEFR